MKLHKLKSERPIQKSLLMFGDKVSSHPIALILALADLGGGGVRDARPPLGVQILSISCSFRENLACSRPHWRVHAPPSGKSWIRHWLDIGLIIVGKTYTRYIIFQVHRTTGEVLFTPFPNKSDSCRIWNWLRQIICYQHERQQYYITRNVSVSLSSGCHGPSLWSHIPNSTHTEN